MRPRLACFPSRGFSREALGGHVLFVEGNQQPLTSKELRFRICLYYRVAPATPCYALVMRPSQELRPGPRIP